MVLDRTNAVLSTSSKQFDGGRPVFGFGRAKQVLESGSSVIAPWMTFAVDFAFWRPNGNESKEGVAYPDFDFEEDVLNEYDALFLLGYSPGEKRRAGSSSAADVYQFRRSPMPAATLGRIANFMKTKGVFATGDHASLGLDMCGEIPRVRNMRAWELRGEESPQDDPGLQRLPPSSPPRGGPYRIDTVQPRTSAQKEGVTWPPVPLNQAKLEELEDALVPDRYEADQEGKPVTPVILQRFPERLWHPICYRGPEELITRFTDHPHEGQTNRRNYALFMSEREGANVFAEEYPGVGKFYRGPGPKPQHIFEARTTSNGTGDKRIVHEKLPVEPYTYPLVTVYDGTLHPTFGDRLGRVVVDSTWHNWLSFNEAEIADKAPIHAYFRNVAAWLCNGDSLGAITGGLRLFRESYPGDAVSVSDDLWATYAGMRSFLMNEQTFLHPWHVSMKLMSRLLDPDSFATWVSISSDPLSPEGISEELLAELGRETFEFDEPTENDRIIAQRVHMSAIAALSSATTHENWSEFETEGETGDLADEHLELIGSEVSRWLRAWEGDLDITRSSIQHVLAALDSYDRRDPPSKS